MGIAGPRQATPDDRDAIFLTANRVMRTEVGKPPTIARDWSHVYDYANIENVMIVTAGELVVSMAGIWTNDIQLGSVDLRVGGINCVATLPEFRRKNLASRTMRAAHHHMEDLGCEVGLLATNITNWYRRLGWERAGSSCTYHFDRSNIVLLPRLPNDVQIDCAGEEAIEDLIRLHHAEHLGGIRNVTVFRQIFSARASNPIIVARSGGRAVAYLLVKGEAVIEWGGPADILGGLIRAWFESIDDRRMSTSARDIAGKRILEDRLTVVAPRSGHALVDRLDMLRIPCFSDYLGMMYLINPRRVLDAFGYSDVSLVSEGPNFTVNHDRDEVTLSRSQLTKLFFGPERVVSFGSSIFPLPFWQWHLERV